MGEVTVAVIQKCVRNMKNYNGPLVPPHPNVVFFKDQGKLECDQQVEHTYSTICKLLQKSLKDYLGRNPDEQTVKIVLLQLAHALNHIHENEWAHGNIVLENTYLSKGRVLLSHTTSIRDSGKASRIKRAKDIGDLQEVFRAIREMKKGEEIQTMDSVIAEDLLVMMKKAPLDASRKTAAEDLLNELEKASINSTTSKTMKEKLSEIMKSIPERFSRKEMEEDLKNISRNSSHVPTIRFVEDLFKKMESAWESFIDDTAPYCDCASEKIPQDLLDMVKNVTENCKKSIAMDLKHVISNASKHSFKDDIENDILSKTDVVMRDYKKSAEDQLREIINTPEGTERILQHPYFWDTERKQNFLAKVTQFSKGGKIGKSIKDALDAKSGDVFGDAGWLAKLSITDKAEQDEYNGNYRKRKRNEGLRVGSDAVKNLALPKSERKLKGSKKNKNKSEDIGIAEETKKYDGYKLQCLLNFIRNKHEHLWEESLEVQACFGYNFTDGYWKFFSRRFPKLFLVVYEVAKERRQEWSDPGIEITYFQTTTENKNLPVLCPKNRQEPVSEEEDMEVD